MDAIIRNLHLKESRPALEIESGLNPRCDIFGHRGTRKRIRLFAGFGRAFLRIARNWVDLLHNDRAA
jgi:hypothetical protein